MYVPVAGDVGEVVEREDHLLTLSEKVSQVAVGSKLHDEAQWATCSTHKAHSSYTESPPPVVHWPKRLRMFS